MFLHGSDVDTVVILSNPTLQLVRNIASNLRTLRQRTKKYTISKTKGSYSGSAHSSR
jgi:hypothetical protein